MPEPATHQPLAVSSTIWNLQPLCQVRIYRCYNVESSIQI